MWILSLEDLKGNGAMFGNKIIGIEPSAGLMLTTQKAMKEYGLDMSMSLSRAVLPVCWLLLNKQPLNQEPIPFPSLASHTIFPRV